MLAIMFLGVVLLLLFFGGLLVFRYFKQNINKEEEKKTFVPTTQDNMPLDYVRNGILKMKNGSFACVIKLPSINIDLMEYEEKEVVFSQYKQILSAIEFPFQFLQQSRIVDVSDYIKKLEKIQKGTTNNFDRYQVDFYKNYIIDLIKTRAVLTKKFYVVVPFDEEREKKKRSNSSGSPLDFSLNKKKKTVEEDGVIAEEKRYENASKQLAMRARAVMGAFARFGIRPELLHDDELTELFYTSYNKSRSVYQPLPKNAVGNLSTIYVKRGE